MVAPRMTFGQPLQMPGQQQTQQSPWWNPYQGQALPQVPQPTRPPAGTMGPSAPPGAYGGDAPPRLPGGWAAHPGGGQWWSDGGQQPGGGGFNYARTANPDPSGRLPGQAGYGTAQPGTGATAQVAQAPARTGAPQAETTPSAANTVGTFGGAQQGGVQVQPDGSWRLPNGTVVPPNARTVINVNGRQIALPFYNGVGMPGRGDYRFNLNGHQEDALTFLSRRLRDAEGRGLNITDPNVIYDEIARIRDDIVADYTRRGLTITDAELDRASGIGGLGNFVRGNQVDKSYAPPGTAPPAGAPGTQPPAAQPGAPGGAPPGAPGAGGGEGRAAFREDQIDAAMQDSDTALRLYKQYTGGSSRAGTGPFSRHFDQWIEPVIMASINAIGAGGKRPTSADVENLFKQIAQNVRGGGVSGQVGGLARNLMDDVTGGSVGQDYDTLRASASAMTPLMALGLSPIYRSGFLRQQQNEFADMYDRAQADPNFGDDLTDWGQRFANSDFYRRWYNLR